MFVKQIQEATVQHSDIFRNRPFNRDLILKKALLEDARRQAIENVNGGNDIVSPLALELGSRVASLTFSDRSQRTSHHLRYRHILGIENDTDIATTDGMGFAESSLLDLHERTSGDAGVDQNTFWHEVGKGISAELGHVDQFGDWSAAHPLDVEMRALPESERLKDAGFNFLDTYGSKDLAKISYSFKIVDDEFGKGVSLMGIRKRAAADIITDSGETYEIIKRSSFLIDGLRIEEDMQPLLIDILKSLQDDDNLADHTRAAAQEAGQAIVEPFVADKDLRERSKVVLAVSSLYFALKRY